MLFEGKVHIRNINKVIKRNEYNTSYRKLLCSIIYQNRNNR